MKSTPSLLYLCAALAAAAAWALPAPESVPASPVLITGGYTEGAVVDREGNLYFSHGEVIRKITPDGTASVWARPGNPNGHKILPDGRRLVCDGNGHGVKLLDAGGRFLEYAAVGRSGDLDIRTPNDLTLDPQGGFYFTDSVADTGAVHHVDGAGRKRVVARNLDYPNGIVLTPDRKRLLVAESRKNRILEIALLEPGVARDRPRTWADLPINSATPGWEFNQPDGIALDAAGRLWVAHFGMKAVHVLDKKGRLLQSYDGGNRLTSNVCFGGPKFDQLYVTGGEPGGVFRLDVKTKGRRLIQDQKPPESESRPFDRPGFFTLPR